MYHIVPYNISQQYKPYLGNKALSVKCGGPFTMYSPSDPRTTETKWKEPPLVC